MTQLNHDNKIKTVVDSCFGFDLDTNYQNIIQNFKEAYIDLVNLSYISITQKFQIIFYHITEFCERNHSGLSMHSERASDAVYSNFQKNCAAGIFLQKKSNSDFKKSCAAGIFYTGT